MNSKDIRSHSRSGRNAAVPRTTTGEPRVNIRSQQRLATRKKILEAAETLIASRGLKDATFEAIAKAAKLSPTLPVFHFKNKKSLFTELLRLLSASYTDSWNAFVEMPGMSSKERLERIIAHDIAFAGKHPRAIAVWFAFWGDRSGRELYRTISRHVDEFYLAAMREAVEKVKAEGGYANADAEAVANAIYLQTFGFWVFHQLHGVPGAEAQIERSLSFLLAAAFPRHFGNEPKF